MLKPMLKPERQAKAKALYTAGRTMEQIAAELGVTVMTISRDLEGLDMPKPERPKGGRPKALPRSQRNPKAAAREDRVAALRDAGLTNAEIAAQTGMHPRNVDQALEHVEIRREAIKQAQPEIDAKLLSMSAQEKFAAAIRQARRNLELEFEAKLQARLKDALNDTILPAYNESYAKHNEAIKTRKGIITRAIYRNILACLHPDRVRDPDLKKKYEAAFHEFTKLEIHLLDEKQSPMAPSFKMPTTYEEWMALKKNKGKKTKQGVAHR
jgi:DNA-binding CsgD family transcriptional regulator